MMEEGRDYYYKILGVSRLASQHEITEAYEKLIYSSPNNSPSSTTTKSTSGQNTSSDEQQFKLIAKAFQVLSDPNKRIQYDREGIIDENEEYSGLDVENLGGIGRVFGAMISRFGGVPLQTQVSKDILQMASQICSNGGILGSGAPLDPRVSDLVWGWSVDGRVARQDAIFYRITVDQIKSKNGFIIFCRSLTGKFKLVIFDSNGEVIHIDESIRSRDGSQWESALYFLSAFSMYRLPPPLPAAIREQDLPSVFNSLDTFTQCNMTLTAGQYLICVYGDNFIGKTSYSLLAVPTLNDCQEAENVQELDKALLQTKESLNKFQSEYLLAKENYEKALKRVQYETDRVDELIEKREYSYGAFMIASANAFLPNSVEYSSPYSRNAPDEMSSITTTAIATETLSQVAHTVATASDWMTSTLTSGLGTLNRFIVGETASPSSSSSATQNNLRGSTKKVLNHNEEFFDVDDEEDNEEENEEIIRDEEKEKEVRGTTRLHLDNSFLPSFTSSSNSSSAAHGEAVVEYGEEEEEEEGSDAGDEDLMIGAGGGG